VWANVSGAAFLAVVGALLLGFVVFAISSGRERVK